MTYVHCDKLELMKLINVTLSPEQLEALVTLADNQFFRMKYIDPKMPGHKSSPENLENARAALQVLQDALKKMKGFGPSTVVKRQISIVRTAPGS